MIDLSGYNPHLEEGGRKNLFRECYLHRMNQKIVQNYAVKHARQELTSEIL